MMLLTYIEKMSFKTMLVHARSSRFRSICHSKELAGGAKCYTQRNASIDSFFEKEKDFVMSHFQVQCGYL